LAVADKRLRHLFAKLPARDAFHKRRLRLSGQIEALIAEFARHSPGFVDDVLLVDSTAVECARSRETVKRGGHSSLGDTIATPLATATAPATAGISGDSDCTPCARSTAPREPLALTSPKIDEKLVCLQTVARCERQPAIRSTNLPEASSTGSARPIPPARESTRSAEPDQSCGV
jgi:hypothetical protein